MSFLLEIGIAAFGLAADLGWFKESDLVNLIKLAAKQHNLSSPNHEKCRDSVAAFFILLNKVIIS